MRRLSCLLSAAFLVACGGAGGGKSEPAPETGSATQSAAQSAEPMASDGVIAVAQAEREVRCGCAVESVGHCGNYVQIDGSFVALGNSEELGLGEMEWCGQKDVHADTAGEIRGGTFYATVLAVNTQ